MLARALTTVDRARQKQQQTAQSCVALEASGGGFNAYQHLAATDELKNYNQEEEDDEFNPDEEGEEAGALRLEEDNEVEEEFDNGSNRTELAGLADRLRPRRGRGASVGDVIGAAASARNLRQDKNELVAEGECAAAAAAAAMLWRPFESASIQQQQQQFQGADLSVLDSLPTDVTACSSVLSREMQQRQQQQQKQKPRIKKPLNAFMLYMRDHRAAVAAQHSLRESAAINRLLGRLWQSLPSQEQARYFHLAQLEKERHCRLHPNWSAKDNYGSCSGGGAVGAAKSAVSQKQQQQQQPRQLLRISATQLTESTSVGNKKCRAIYGLHRQDLWCRPCKRKKRCCRFGGVDGGSGAANLELDAAVQSATNDCGMG